MQQVRSRSKDVGDIHRFRSKQGTVASRSKYGSLDLYTSKFSR